MCNDSKNITTSPLALLGEKVSVPELPQGSLDEAQAKQLFSCFGIPSVRETIASDAAAAQAAANALGPKVVLKLLSREVAHKSEVGGVAVGVTADQMPERIKAMQEKVLACTGKTPERYMVQDMVSGVVEMLLGVHRDPIV